MDKEYKYKARNLIKALYLIMEWLVVCALSTYWVLVTVDFALKIMTIGYIFTAGGTLILALMGIYSVFIIKKLIDDFRRIRDE
ncbi:hypothetical protein [Weissella kandleri]|uniref:hypothetical protein n=1 Tax=Weissella kandleri TaxID=1616 RepID=UPI00070D87BD|nr:hypothetical protein [Weissella kandleri]